MASQSDDAQIRIPDAPNPFSFRSFASQPGADRLGAASLAARKEDVQLAQLPPVEVATENLTGDAEKGLTEQEYVAPQDNPFSFKALQPSNHDEDDSFDLSRPPSSLAQLFAQKSISSEIEEQQLNHNHREVNVSLQQSNQLNLQQTSKACHRADAIDDGDDRDGKNAPSVYSAAEAGTQDESEASQLTALLLRYEHKLQRANKKDALLGQRKGGKVRKLESRLAKIKKRIEQIAEKDAQNQQPELQADDGSDDDSWGSDVDETQVPASVRRVSATANLQKQECTESKSNADSLAGSWDSDPEGSWDSDDDEAAQPVRLEANDRTTKKFEINCGGKAVNQPSSLAAEPLPSPSVDNDGVNEIEVLESVRQWASASKTLPRLIGLITTVHKVVACVRPIAVPENATAEQLRDSYKAIIRCVHPDKLRDASPRDVLAASYAFDVLKHAYDHQNAPNYA